MTQQFTKLIDKLHEIFEFDRADLDFGIYRIMNMKRDQIVQYLDSGLLPQVRAALADYQSGDKEGLRNSLVDLEKSIRDAGMNPDDSPKVKDLRAKLAASTDLTDLENEVYSHLYNFFRRYYHEGDFISQRRYKEGVYAIPYEGEEVKLHWANHDQYYIKTSEYLRDYTFRIDGGKRVHFKLVEATTEKDNVKAQKGKERRFALVEEDPVVVENGEAVIRFTYLPNPEKQADLNAQTIEALKANSILISDFRRIFATDSTPANPDRTVIEKHLTEYTARNTFDYFIHKNLGRFLRTELDFFIKNEVLHLDDVDTDGVGVAELQKRLAKIKALRRIALKLIELLAQLEDFQKKLWLKKKFVVETNYLVTLDRVPEELYPEIAANDKQREEWVRLFAINEIKGGEGEDMLTEATPGYSVPLTVEFLKANRGLVVDSIHFPEVFKRRLLDALDEIDQNESGLLIQSENFGALNLVNRRLHKSVDCIFSDPPYNTGLGDFPYKDSFMHSSWMSMIENRYRLLARVLADTGACWTTLDNREANNFQKVAETIFSDGCFVDTVAWSDIIAWEKVYSPRMDAKQFSTSVDFIFVFSGQPNWSPKHLKITPNLEQFPHLNEKGDRYRSDPLRKWGKNSLRQDRPNLWYPITSPDGTEVWPIKPDGTEGCWRWQGTTVAERYAELDWLNKGNGLQPYVRQYAESSNKRPVETLWNYEDVGSTHEAAEELKAIVPKNEFKTIKPTRLIQRSIVASGDDDLLVLDCFAGSGSTGHAAINSIREEGMDIRYGLIELGDHFDYILKPRIAKVVYCDTWKDGKPQNRNTGISHLCKVIRLESYEDALANLTVTPPEGVADMLDAAPDSMGEEYLLRYMLDEETRGSASLVNVGQFADPTAYKLKVKAPGTDETREVNVDLLETFNWLIGLRVDHIAAPQVFTADFERDENERLTIKGDRLRKNDDGPHWFQTVTGWVPENLHQPHDSRRLKVLIIWRKLTGDPEADNLVLDHFMRKQKYTARDLEFDLVYVNGDNTLENLKRDDETWKVRLIEEDFQRLMFDVEDV